ncbi:MAG: G-D-S-L family lipolytic protein [Sphingobacteriaceae bacterium]|nr:MAG: G-D-S-L family lipolytic protein [Sphingobacteriaceae bacterium]
MMKPYLNWAFAAVILLLASCVDKDVPDPAPVITSGTANFSRYIAVGNSLAAGVTNNGLYQAGQQVAYPNLLAGQFALAGGGSFTSPLFPVDQPNGTGYLKVTGLNSDGTPIITQVVPQAVRGQTTLAGINVTLYTKYTGELNNYGVPGIKVADLFDATYGNFNGFYERLLPGNAGSNITPYVSFVTTNTKASTFVTVELGSNDALDYATSDGMTTSRMLTDQTLFNVNYGNAVFNFLNPSKGGVVTTVPDVTVLPYFHYVTLSTLRAALQKKGFNPDNPVIIQALDASGTYSSRAATDGDYFMLTFDPNLVGGTNPANRRSFYGTLAGDPLASSAVLDKNEILKVQGAINGYNNSIKSFASKYSIPVLDIYTLFNQLRSGVTQDGVTIGTNFLTGGVFSLDGIHLTPRGNAYLTDELIKVINAKYGSTLPALDISKYGGAGSN